MNYDELIAKALNGRSVNSVAKAWGVRQPTLDRWLKGQGLPDYNTTLKMANDAGIEAGEALLVLAAEERALKVKNFKLQMGFVQIEHCAMLALISFVALFILCQMKTTKAKRFIPFTLFLLFEVTTLQTSTNRMAS